ncbi:hypothetical protein SDC9_201246 [bioreactor metagenome]|uniref:Uncharacterized protein n=1 Tax=bioreactor metagenome TaxID=1076179 RepID=A0A645IRX9_9ZZZZ
MMEKLDALAQEREVLIALRDLARAELREGDTLTHRIDGTVGRLTVQRTGPAAGIVVQTNDGKRLPFSTDWVCRSR